MDNRLTKFRIVFLLLLIVVLSESGFSQAFEEPISQTYQEKTSFFGRLGYVMPNGEFEDDNLEDENSGIAKPGFGICVGINHLISSKTFIIAELGFQSNPIDEDRILGFYRANIPSYLDVSMTSSNWISINMMAGMGIIIPVDEEINFAPRFKIGLSTVISPQYTVTVTNGIDVERQMQSTGSGSNFALAVGGDFMIPLADDIDVLIGADYFQTEAAVEDVSFRVDFNGNQIFQETYAFEQKISTLTLSFGISVKL